MTKSGSTNYRDFRDDADKLNVNYERGDNYVGFYSAGYIALGKRELGKLAKRLSAIHVNMKSK